MSVTEAAYPRLVSGDFIQRWRHVRGMTVDFVREASADCLDFRPGPSFSTIREQAAHLSEVQGIYQLALVGDHADWARKPEFSPTSYDPGAIIDALERRDRELDRLLESLAPSADAHRIDWYGRELTISAFGSVFIQHEAIHHGQWATHAALGGHPTPASWQMNWGL
jgi:uncharacterized damage-inducible protein DinB